MRVIIHGRVTQDVLDRAELIADIFPTSLVTSGAEPKLGFTVTAYPLCEKLGDLAGPARDYTLVQQADAAVIVGRNPHLVQVAEQYGLPLYQEV